MAVAAQEHEIAVAFATHPDPAIKRYAPVHLVPRVHSDWLADPVLAPRQPAIRPGPPAAR
jgi:hypothetical protein